MANQRRIFLVLTLASIAFVVSHAVAQSVFPIVVQQEGKKKAAGLGLLIADELVLTSQQLILQGDQVLVEDVSGNQNEAKIAASNENSDLALLEVTNLTGDFATVAREEVGRGRHVHLLVTEGSRREGVFQSVYKDEQGQQRYRFTEVHGEKETAAPLMNNCGELLAISQFVPEALPGVAGQDLGTSGSLLDLVKFLEENEVAFQMATEVCPSVVQEKEKSEEKLEEVEQKKTELEKEVATTQAELKKREEEQAKLEQQKRQREEELVRKDEELAESQRRAEAEVRLRWSVGGVLGGVLILFGALARRQARLRRSALMETARELESVRESLDRKSMTFSNMILVGDGSAGRKIRVKINGNGLATADKGQIIGRSSKEADHVIAEESVSRKHARLRVADDEMTVEDLNSFNGTILDGLKLTPGEPRKVTDGGTLVLGDIEVTVRFLKN